jgi:hypothetical protein
MITFADVGNNRHDRSIVKNIGLSIDTTNGQSANHRKIDFDRSMRSMRMTEQRDDGGIGKP